ncbi:MAG: N-acetylglucosamine-specific PTS transporter subunit IIBC [Longibaculum muris]|uniref:PTS system N-acetylglucosamine-specific IIB component (Glc family) /PTS system N-acetylglucosamine-specific IIC component (Glc family) n=2 Tax=Longibaculum muris TaxID=1796628 RepID=A0A4R3YLI7_9FIRM|nr:N-acetylglucosamine-specific PTS transporter subunit IIBC [Longibaculum muris]KXU42911.1 PTS system, N-acetylglucosamine-specific IIBC component [Candidatus Stoquefichus sp. KLE1796]MCR1889135.1 N-acetylglucosamine-specific PTS transporter subunit IIBC [Longibaculum muris]MED9810752.1 N-acetylglucosamine-specific PTS transporter subunit IIBC [Longibaculum muris]TCV91673.1 PTS system N-acetylglucosamine-specific IIB component (Glc family) /PTS system N-acetylglucosamine-specific IIC component
MKYLQRLGKSLMLPVSIMPIAAILKGIGYWIDPVGWGANNVIAAFLIESGGVIIDNLPLLFAIGIAIGMVEDKDAMLVMSAVVSYMIINKLLSAKTVSLLMDIPLKEVPIAFNNSSNALIGIMIGLMCAFYYQKFHHIQLPQSLSFFGGKRFVPIICSATTLLISALFLVIWPNLFNAFIMFGEFMSKLGPFGAALYGFFNRLLIPTGLHHALNSVFWFDVAGIDDIGKFWGRVSGGVVGVTGMYQAGFFPIMMFGLPGAAVAIYKCARKEKRKQVGAILLSAAFASFLTGVTEPLEFTFMFAAPSLYFIHALLTGVFMYIAATFKWIAGFGFSAGFIDYVLSIKAPFAHDILMLIPLGIVCFLIYYLLFRFMIVHYRLMTPGREIEENIIQVEKPQYHYEVNQLDYDDMAIILIEALGGASNIVFVDSCLTRLRIDLKDMSCIDENKILAVGASGIVKLGKDSLQIILGIDVEFIVDVMKEILGR